MSTPPTYFLTAASGNIGKRLVPLLLNHQSKPKLVLPTSDAQRLTSQLPAGYDPSRVVVIQGDIQDPQFVQRTLVEHEVTGVFLCLTGDNELFITMNFFDAVKRSGTVRHLVYLSACGDFSLDAVKSGVLKHAAFGHGSVKIITEATLKYGLPARGEKGGFSYTILGPSLFFDNDLRSKKFILEKNFFNEPIGSKGVSRVDPADIALATVKAFEDDGKKWHGQKIMIGSKQTYTNKDIERIWSKALGREIKAAQSDEVGLNQLEEHISKFRNPSWGRDMRLMYEFFENHVFGMTEDEYQDRVQLLGKEPASYEEFVAETVKSWKSSS